jgi:hypothetical protein
MSVETRYFCDFCKSYFQESVHNRRLIGYAWEGRFGNGQGSVSVVLPVKDARNHICADCLDDFHRLRGQLKSGERI